MVRLRHRNWFQRTALLAMAALLWSQFALAGHGDCLTLPGTPAAFAAADTRHDHGHDCDIEPPSANQALCDAHCTQGDLSADSGRIPAIPPLFVGAWLAGFAIADGAPSARSTRVDTPPRPSWHRPTAHPAALLLI